jgi:HTH-type transcriptional repressor of NAD biosynthesis genes
MTMESTVKKICIYGPESTGKTTLAIRLAEKFDTVSVPEVAREMLIKNDFDVLQIIAIGKAQTQRILNMLPRAKKFLFCDTDLITTQIYAKHYLGVVPEILFDLEKVIAYDHYFFLDIDVPWVADGLRDLGNKREEMREIFLHELDKRKIPYTLVQGTFEEREQFVSSQLRKWA